MTEDPTKAIHAHTQIVRGLLNQIPNVLSELRLQTHAALAALPPDPDMTAVDALLHVQYKQDSLTELLGGVQRQLSELMLFNELAKRALGHG